MPAIRFPAPPVAPYPGGCTIEPAMYALDFYVKWRSDVEVGGRLHPDVVVLDLLREVLGRPESFGVTATDASEAVERFVTLAGQTLEREGGSSSWLRREFGATT